MTMLAAFKTLLHRYTGETDLVVGTGNANRNRAEIQGLIGFFVNSLVMRTDFSGNPTFRKPFEECVKSRWELWQIRICPSSSWSKSFSRNEVWDTSPCSRSPSFFRMRRGRL
jgi:non-ribosomal peptide synthetase component F